VPTTVWPSGRGARRLSSSKTTTCCWHPSRPRPRSGHACAAKRPQRSPPAVNWSCEALVHGRGSAAGSSSSRTTTASRRSPRPTGSPPAASSPSTSHRPVAPRSRGRCAPLLARSARLAAPRRATCPTVRRPTRCHARRRRSCALASPALACCPTSARRARRERAEAGDGSRSEKDAGSAQKLGQLRPFIAVFPQECTGQLASFGPT
jgi:hypothetical protein